MKMGTAMINEICLLLNFEMIGPSGISFNCRNEFLRDDKEVHLLEIPEYGLRRFIYDGYYICLMNYGLNEQELIVRDNIYLKYNLSPLLMKFTLLTREKLTVERIFSFARRLSDNKILRKRTGKAGQMQSRSVWKSSMEWSDQEIAIHNELNYLVNGNDVTPPPLVFLEPEASPESFVTDILNYPGQVIMICENLSDILSVYERNRKNEQE